MMQAIAGVPPPGSVIAGRYTIERMVGQGGMGVVLAAHDGRTNTRVAVKLMYEHDAKNAVSVERFDREARAAGRLTSAYVTRLIDIDRTPEGVPYMVMEFLDGEDLAKRLKTRGPLPIDEAVRYIKQAASACAEAHAVGVIHRDIKPSNLFVSRTRGGVVPSVKLVDFGVSKLQGMSGTVAHGITASGELAGSALYMPPEQLRAKDVDGRADVWALGVSLYELITGKRPFEGPNMLAECNRILLEQPAPPSKIQPKAAPLDAIILRCLSKDPAGRYATANDLAAALAPFARGDKQPGSRAPLVIGVLFAIVAGGGFVAWRVVAAHAIESASGAMMAAPPTATSTATSTATATATAAATTAP